MYAMTTIEQPPWPHADDLRKIRGTLSVEKAAREVGVGRQAWVAWEKGDSTPRYDNLKSIVEAFNCPPEMVGFQAPNGWDLVPADWVQAQFAEIQAKLDKLLKGRRAT